MKQSIIDQSKQNHIRIKTFQLTSMYSFMNIERGLLCESFVANFALKWFFASMNSHVDVKVGLPAECGVTLSTLKWFVHRPITWNTRFINSGPINNNQIGFVKKKNISLIIFHFANI